MAEEIIYPYASDFTPLLGGKCQSKRKKPISRITPHHVAGVVQGENGVKSICAMWKQRGASTNYIIDVKGNSYLVVPHNSRSWASSNSANDDIAITFEMSNDKAKYPWSIGNATIETAIDLTAWVCAKYGIIPIYDGTKDASITLHKMFSATQCPGDYFVREWLNTGRFVRGVVQRKIEWEKRLAVQTSTPAPNQNATHYIQIGAWRSKAGAAKQAATLDGYTVISDKDGLYKVIKPCTAGNLDSELAKARKLYPSAFKGGPYGK